MPNYAEKRMIRIAKDTIKNPNKALLGGPSVAEAKKILKKYGIKIPQSRAKGGLADYYKGVI
tara:strand:- start:40 stop:225 length:186 start_codon:yes stop_codon:yes gene_type:complete